jgi:hypothetical protein
MGGEEMKNMKNLVIAISAFTVVIAGCGKGEYKPITTVPTTTSTEAATTVDPISKFTTQWFVEENSPVLTAVHLRTLANFLGFNTSHYAIQGGQKYGFKSETAPTGPSFVVTDVLRNYFTSSDHSYTVYPAPKDLGAVSYYKIRFAANVNDNTRKIIPGDAYLDVNVMAAGGSFNVKFATVKSPMQVLNDVTCDNNTPAVPADDFTCDKVSVTFADDCGDLAFKADVLNGELLNPVITFLNEASSYKAAGCYSDRKLPNDIIKYNYSMPSTLPEGIHSEDAANDGTDDGIRGELFKAAGGYAGMPMFIEQL